MSANDFQFEEFHQSGERFTPYVSINNTGVIGLSSGFTKKYDFNDKVAPAAKLFYDRNKKVVGISFSKTKEEGMVNVKYIAGGGAQINGKAFWTKFDVLYREFVNKYLPSKQDDALEPHFFIVDLKDPVNKNA